MIEGLWVVRFLEPEPEQHDLTGGVLVIETGRILGGDSGYIYIGDVRADRDGTLSFSLKIQRHDPRILSIFGDMDEYKLHGHGEFEQSEAGSHPSILVDLENPGSPVHLRVRLVKVAELP